jgi:phage gpG-like protein
MKLQVKAINQTGGVKNLMLALQKAKQESNGFVGIVGKGKPRNDSVSNIQLAVTHEFGYPEKNIPRRSFLIDTVEYKTKEIQATAESLYKQAFIKQTETQPMAKLMLKVKAFVDESFETGGFGKWAPLKEATIKTKGSDAILIDKGFLSDSITTKTW